MDFNAFTTLDFVVVFIIASSTLFALFKGFTSSLLSLLGWILAIYLTYTLYPFLEPILNKKISNKLVVTSLGYGGLFVTLLIVFAIINLIISSSIRTLNLGFIDSTLGGVFGFLRGFLIVSFLYFCVSQAINIAGGTDPKEEKKIGPKWLTEAQTYDFLRFGKNVLATLTSDSLDERFDKLYGDISEKTKDQRFIAYAIEEMSKNIPVQDRKQIDEKNAKDSLTKSDEEVEVNTLKSLLNIYSKQSNKDNKSTLTSEDIKRLEAIIKNFNLKDATQDK